MEGDLGGVGDGIPVGRFFQDGSMEAEEGEWVVAARTDVS